MKAGLCNPSEDKDMLVIDQLMNGYSDAAPHTLSSSIHKLICHHTRDSAIIWHINPSILRSLKAHTLK